MPRILPLGSQLLRPTVSVTAPGVSQPPHPPMTLKRLGTEAAGLNAAPHLVFAVGETRLPRPVWFCDSWKLIPVSLVLCCSQDAYLEASVYILEAALHGSPTTHHSFS